MQVQVAGLLVAAVDDDLARAGRHQRAGHGHAGVVVWSHHDGRARLQAGGVAVGLQVRHRRRACGLRGGQRLFRGHGRGRAVADGGDAVEPGHQGCQAQQFVHGGGAVLAQQEGGLPAGQVQRAGRVTKEEGAARGQGSLQPAVVRVHGLQVARQVRRHRGLAHVKAQVAVLAVLDELGRQLVADVVRQHPDGGHPQGALPCEGQALRHPGTAVRVQRGRGAQALQGG